MCRDQRGSFAVEDDAPLYSKFMLQIFEIAPAKLDERMVHLSGERAQTYHTRTLHKYGLPEAPIH
jgi:hypothetical protein